MRTFLANCMRHWKKNNDLLSILYLVYTPPLIFITWLLIILWLKYIFIQFVQFPVLRIIRYTVFMLTGAEYKYEPHAVVVRDHIWRRIVVFRYIIIIIRSTHGLNKLATQSLPRQVCGDGQLESVRQQDSQGDHDFDDFWQTDIENIIIL